LNPYFFIVLKGQESLAWSIVAGWVSDDGFDLFTESEKQTRVLPQGGEWREAYNV